MAAATSDSVTPAQLETGHDNEDIDDEDSLLECLSCNEQQGFLMNPKTLHCGHTFCVTCLVNHCVDDVITCYKCGEKTTSSIDELPSALKKPTFCNTCERIDKIQYKTACMYCVECDRKYCASHFKAHNNLNDHHQMLTIQNYLKSSFAQELRFCDIHKNRTLCLGCKTCWMITCAKCLSTNATCEQASGDNGHNLVSIEEVAEELRASVEPDKIAAENKFDEIAALVKEITIMLSDWDTKTEHTVRLIHQTRDQQLAVIQEKYAKLEFEYMESRRTCKEKITSYIAEEAGPLMSDFLEDIKILRSNLSDLHPVDLVRERREIEKRINELIAEDFPVLTLSKQSIPSQTEAEKREPEIELLPADDVVFGDKIGGSFRNPPATLQLVREVTIKGACNSVCYYKGFTYVGRDHGRVDRVEDQGNVISFINQGYNDIISVRAHEDQLYVLVYSIPHTIYVHDMSGKQLRSWKHSDKSVNPWGSKMAIVNKQLIAAGTSSKQVIIYDSITGSVIKSVSCPQISANNQVAMCEGGGNSVIISDEGSSKVFKLDLTTGVMEWISNHVPSPQGLTLLGDYHVAVSAEVSGTKVWILDLKSGELVRELTDTSNSRKSFVFDLYMDGDILITPRYNDNKILYYMVK